MSLSPAPLTLIMAALVTLSGCARDVQQADARLQPIKSQVPPPATDRPLKMMPINPGKEPSSIWGETLILQSWVNAENARTCAPIGSRFGNANMKSALVVPSRPSTQVGWAILFNHPDGALAYSIEGMGSYAPDEEGDSEEVRRAELQKKWPAFRALPQLAPGAYAVYMALGEPLHNPQNPDGVGMATKAFVRIPGQKCTYNIADRISRVHLEHFLDGLRMIKVPKDALEPE